MELKKVDLATYNNSDYHPGATPAGLLFWYFVNVLFFRNPLMFSSRVKVFFLKGFGAQVGTGVVIKPSVNIKYPWHLSIGDNAWIGENVWIDSLTKVTIGKNVCISQGALILSGNHNYKKENFRLMLGKIVLEEGVWVGAKSVVCAGVTCHSHSILTVGSVTSKSLDAYGIYQGNPAVKIRERVIE